MNKADIRRALELLLQMTMDYAKSNPCELHILLESAKIITEITIANNELAK